MQRLDASGFVEEMVTQYSATLFIPCDITDVDALRAAMAEAEAAHGPI